MRGHIVKRTGKRKINGKPEMLYYVVLAIGDKRKWESVPPPRTQKHAEQFLAQRLSEVAGGEYRELKKITFGQFKDIWVQNYAEGHVRHSSLVTFDGFFKYHLLPAFGEKQLTAITPEDVQAFKAAKMKQPRDLVRCQIEGKAPESDEPLSPQTVKHLLRLLRQMLDHAVEWGYLRTNPAKKVSNPKVLRKEMECYTPAEVRALLGAVPEEWQAFFLCAISGGLRIGELLAMRWANLDWDKGQYYVKETWQRPRGGRRAYFSEPKTTSSIAPVDLIPEALDALRAHQQRQAELKNERGEKYQDQGLIFTTANGTAHDEAHVINRTFRTAVKTADLRLIRFHDLRHTCASLLIAQNENPKYIQKQLRHASIEITFDRYGHLLPDANQAAARRLSKALFPDDPKAADG